jgi:phytoene desaturase
LIKALVRIAEKNGVVLRANSPVAEIIVKDKKAAGVKLENGEIIEADLVVSNADMQFTETKMLQKSQQTYPEKYWKKRILAPSAFIMYLGVKEKLPGLTHHNLLFSQDWRKNFAEIYKNPQLPLDPSLYVCAPSVTDSTVAPEGKENLFVLVPIASGLEITEAEKEKYAVAVLEIMEREMNLPDLREKIEYKRLYTVSNFAADYNSYRGSTRSIRHPTSRLETSPPSATSAATRTPPTATPRSSTRATVSRIARSSASRRISTPSTPASRCATSSSSPTTTSSTSPPTSGTSQRTCRMPTTPTA